MFEACDTVIAPELTAWGLHFGAGFLIVGSEGNVRQWSLLARRRLLFRNRPLELRCGAVLKGWFLVGSEGNGACLLGAASVLQCHGVLLFRNRAVLRAWELHFGAGFLSVQKATLGSGACLLGTASVLQCHGVLLFRNRPLRLDGMRAALWSWFLVGSEGIR